MRESDCSDGQRRSGEAMGPHVISMSANFSSAPRFEQCIEQCIGRL